MMRPRSLAIFTPCGFPIRGRWPGVKVAGERLAIRAMDAESDTFLRRFGHPCMTLAGSQLWDFTIHALTNTLEWVG